MFTFAGCLGGSDDSETPQLIQTGSSTVLPLAVAWAEEYDGAEITFLEGVRHGLNALLSGEADLEMLADYSKERIMLSLTHVMQKQLTKMVQLVKAVTELCL